jgi:hypothetical protein
MQLIMNQTGALEIVTQRTGGEFTWDPRDAIRLLKKMPDDFRAYYSIGYRATGTAKDRAHAIRVTVKNPGLTVRSRGEYVEKSYETRMGERVMAQLYGLDAAQPTIPIDVTLGKPKRMRNERYALPVSVRIPIAALTPLPEGSQSRGSFSIYVASISGNGGVSDLTRKQQVFTIPIADLAKAQRSHFTYDVDVQLADEAATVAVGVLDDISKDFGLKKVGVTR